MFPPDFQRRENLSDRPLQTTLGPERPQVWHRPRHGTRGKCLPSGINTVKKLLVQVTQYNYLLDPPAHVIKHLASAFQNNADF